MLLLQVAATPGHLIYRPINKKNNFLIFASLSNMLQSTLGFPSQGPSSASRPLGRVSSLQSIANEFTRRRPARSR